MKENKPLAILANILLVIVLVLFLVANIGRILLSEDTVKHIARNSMDVLSILEEEISPILEENDISSDVVKKLEQYEEAYYNVIDKIVVSSFVYLREGVKDFSFVKEDVEQIIYRGIKNYEEENQVEIWNFIEEDVKRVSVKIQNLVESSDSISILKEIDNLVNGSTYYILLLLIVIFLTIEIIYAKGKSMLYLGATCLGLSFLMYYYIATNESIISVPFVGMENIPIPEIFDFIEKVYIVGFAIGAILLIIYSIMKIIIPIYRKVKVGYYKKLF